MVLEAEHGTAVVIRRFPAPIVGGPWQQSGRMVYRADQRVACPEEIPMGAIRMKLSIHSRRTCNGFVLLVQALPQYLCGGLSFS